MVYDYVYHKIRTNTKANSSGGILSWSDTMKLFLALTSLPVSQHLPTYQLTSFLVFKPTIEKMVNPTIEFKETFKFDKVKSDFIIVVEVFGLFANATSSERPTVVTSDETTLTPKQNKKLNVIFKSIRHNLTPKTRRSRNSVSDIDYVSTPPPTTPMERATIDFNPRFHSYAKGFISLGNVKNGYCGAIKLDAFDDACCLESKLNFRLLSHHRNNIRQALLPDLVAPTRFYER